MIVRLVIAVLIAGALGTVLPIALPSAQESAAPQERPFAMPPPDISALEDLVVLANGRMKPLATHAAEAVISYLGVSRYESQAPLETYLSMLFRPESWLDRRFLSVSPDLGREAFGGRTVLSPREVFDAQNDLIAIVRRAQSLGQSHAGGQGVDTDRLARLEDLRDEIMEVFNQAVGPIENLAPALRILPDPSGTDGEWLSVDEARAAVSEGRTVFEPGVAAFDRLKESYLAGDSAAFAASAAALQTAQRDIAAGAGQPVAVLSTGMVRLEILYYMVDFKWAGLVLFGLSTLVYILFALKRGRGLSRLAILLLLAGILWNCWIVGGHTAIAGRLPLKNLQEVFLVVLFFVPLIGVLLQVLLRSPLYSGIAAGLTAVGFMGSLFLEPEGYMIAPLVAILHSPWRQVHILTIMLSYAILLVAMGLHAGFLGVVVFQRGARTVTDGKASYSVVAADLDRRAYFMVAWGFLFLTVGIATGAAWGHSSWGRYWGWDSKEVWATVAWAVYAFFLHMRLFFRTRPEMLALINILGYAAILFTYFGVSYLLPGLHAYS